MNIEVEIKWYFGSMPDDGSGEVECDVVLYGSHEDLWEALQDALRACSSWQLADLIPKSESYKSTIRYMSNSGFDFDEAIQMLDDSRRQAENAEDVDERYPEQCHVRLYVKFTDEPFEGDCDNEEATSVILKAKEDMM